MKSFVLNTKTIPISDLRRKFGEIEEMLPLVDYFTLTKKGRPFAILSATPAVKKEILKKFAGILKNTELDNDGLWREVLKRKSRKRSIRL